jgi:hypothetical protein
MHLCVLNVVQVAVSLGDFRLKFYTSYDPQFVLLDLITIILLGEK